MAQRSVREVLPESEDGIVELPADAELGGYSPQAQDWLKQYGITHNDLLTFDVLFSHKQNALIFPFYDIRGGLFAYQMRQFAPGKPKWHTVGKIHSEPVWFTGDGLTTLIDTVVLVKDVVSAMKVGHICDTIVLFGTDIKKAVIDGPLECYKNVVLWLDKDAQKKAIEYSHQLHYMLQGSVNCYVISTEEDPKAHTIREIEELLANCVSHEEK